jgi:hypothetical protein
MGTLQEDLCTFMTTSGRILVEKRNISDRSRENQYTHFMWNNFSPESYAVWVNMEKYGRPTHAIDDNKILRRKDVICMPDN